MFPPPAAQTSHKVPSACQARSPPQNSHLLRWGLHFTRRRRQPVHIFQGEIRVRPPQTARPTRADAGRGHGVAEVICAAAGMPPTIFQRMRHRFYAASGIELDQLVKQVTRTTSSHHVRNMHTTQYATRYLPLQSRPHVILCQGGYRVSVCLEQRAIALARDALARGLELITASVAGENPCRACTGCRLVQCSVSV
jgi:hypothetical protein